MAQLPPDRLPLLLRIAGALLFTLGLVGLSLSVVLGVLGADEFRWKRVVTSALTLHGGWRVLKGHEDGVTGFFWLFGFVAIAGVVAHFLEGDWPPAVYVGIAIAWVGFVGFGLAKYRLPWSDDESGDDSGVASLGAPVPRAHWDAAREARDFECMEDLIPRVPLEEGELLAVIEDCSLDLDTARRAYAAALTQLVDRGFPSAESAIERAIALGHPWVSEQAARELCSLRGLPRDPIVRDGRVGHEAQVVRSMWWLNTYVNEGGLFQAFGSMTKKDWLALPGALRTIGPPEMEALVTRAMGLVTEGPMPANESARHDLLAERCSEICEDFERLDAEYESIRWRMELSLLLYCAGHADVLRRVVS